MALCQNFTTLSFGNIVSHTDGKILLVYNLHNVSKPDKQIESSEICVKMLFVIKYFKMSSYLRQIFVSSEHPTK